VDAVVWMVYNTGPPTSTRDLMVHEAKSRLSRQCGANMPPITAADFSKKLIQQVLDNPEDKTLMESTHRALILLARNQEYRWVHNNIQDTLLNVLMKQWNAEESASQNANAIFTWVILSLGSICRLLPADARENSIEPLRACLVNVLKEAPSSAVEDAALHAFVGASHHMQMQAAKFLYDWQPKYSLPADTEAILADFVGTRARKFGEKTVEVQKKRQIFAL